MVVRKIGGDKTVVLCTHSLPVSWQGCGVRLPHSIGDHTCSPPRWPAKISPQIQRRQSYVYVSAVEQVLCGVCFCVAEGTVW